MNLMPRVRFDEHAEALRQLIRLAAGGMAERNHEFLAAVARHQIALADVFLEDARHDSEDLISDGVRELIIDLLEAVQVSNHQGERLTVAHRLCIQARGMFVEVAPIEEAGE